MSHANDIFWPELHPSLMPPHFNNYPQLLLAEGDSWFAWAWLGFDVSPSILNALKFNRPTATLCYAYTGHTSGDMAAMSVSAGFMQEFSARRFQAVLLSGGGNDLFNALEQGNILKPAGGADPNDPASYIDTVALDALIARHGHTPEAILGEEGLLAQLTKALVERAIACAEA